MPGKCQISLKLLRPRIYRTHYYAFSDTGGDFHSMYLFLLAVQTGHICFVFVVICSIFSKKCRHVARIVSLGAASVFGGQTYFEYYYTAIAGLQCQLFQLPSILTS